MYTNNIEENSKLQSGIPINQIGDTDHQAIFTCQENDAYLELKRYTKQISLQKFVDELKCLNIYYHLKQTVSSNL